MEEALLGREDESSEVLCHRNQSTRGLQGGGHKPDPVVVFFDEPLQKWDLCFLIEFGSPGHCRPYCVLIEAFGGYWTPVGDWKPRPITTMGHPCDGPGPGTREGQPHTSPSVFSWWCTGLEVRLCLMLCLACLEAS